MRKILVLFAVFLIVAISISTYQNSPEAILDKIGTVKLKAGLKEAIYEIYLFGILPVGKAVLSEEGVIKYKDENLYHLNAKAESEGIVSKIYPFSANIDSYLEPGTMLPLIFKQSIKTKDKEISKEAKYDQTNNIMQIKDERRSILPETYEPLSAFLKLRNMDLDKTASFDLNINTNQKNYAFRGSVKKDGCRLKGGTQKIYRLSVKIFRRDKNPYHQSQVDFIFLADKAKTPIFIKVFASGGLITMRLVNAE